MKKIILGLFAFLFLEETHAQNFSFDQKYYQTISWNTFFQRLDKNPNLVFFDVRTAGERSDTSEYPSYNQGKIKGALETDFFEFDQYYPEYLKHKNDTIYLYCSHSRRSRRLAKRLAYSSFTKVISVNAGMSYLNSISDKKFPLKSKYYTNKLSYKLITPEAFVKGVADKKVQLIDVRPDSVYFGTAIIEWENSFGNIATALHIPFDKIASQLNLIDKSKEIMLFDNDGNFAPLAANILIEYGYNCGVLIFGLDNLTAYTPEKQRKFLKTKYQMLLPSELLKKTKKTNTVIIDVRTITEFNSTDTIAWKNVGRLKNAINIPLSTISKTAIEPFKDKKIVIYDIMMHDELYEFAKQMKSYGIKDFYMLIGGITQVKWEIYNLEKKELKALLDE